MTRKSGEEKTGSIARSVNGLLSMLSRSVNGERYVELKAGLLKLLAK